MLLKYTNKFRGIMLSRIKVILLLSLIFVSLITTLPILQSTNAGAQVKIDSDTSTDNQIKSWLYYEAIAYCMTKDLSLQPAIWADDAINGKWFSGASANTGLYLTGANNTGDEILCSDASFIKAALSLWGLSPADVLCGSAFLRQNAANDTVSCRTGITNFYRPSTPQYNSDRFKEYIRNTIYGGKEPALTEPQQYIFYRKSVEYGCIPGINEKPFIGEITSGGDDVYNGVSWVELSTGELFTNGAYSNGENSWHSDTKWVSADIGVMNCANIVQSMNNMAEAYSDWAIKHPKERAEIAANANLNKDGTTTCAIDGIGWIICPVVKFLGNIADGAFGFLANQFLKTDPGIFSKTPTLSAWGAMRNIANIVFVIAFLIIIFSQLTSVGITNYGIKKMLPRLIIAAILVNLSYFICQIAVDISNILGWTLKDFLENLIQGSPITESISKAATGSYFSDIAVKIVALGGTLYLLYASLSAFIPILLAAIVALIMILFILIARQALIVLLIVISPLAFVAFLLPNTMPWFTKWQKAFIAMLMLFPIVALVFGMSKLASVVLTSVAFDNTTTDNWFMQVAAAAVAVLPLFVVPGLLKKALDGVGSIGGKISGFGDKWGGAAGKPVGTWVGKQKEKANTMADLKAFTSKRPSYRRFMVQRRARIAGIDQNRQTELNRSKVGYVAGEAKTNVGYRTRLAQGGGPGADMRALAGAKNILAKLNIEEVTAAKAVIKDLSQESLQKLSQGLSADGLDAANSLALKTAAMQMTIGSQDVVGINKLLDMAAKPTGSPDGMDLETRRSFADSLEAAPNRLSYVGNSAIAGIRAEDKTGIIRSNSTDLAIGAINGNVYSPDKFASSSGDELQFITDVAQNKPVAQNGQHITAKATAAIAQTAQIKGNAQVALTNPLYSGRISKQFNEVTAISKLP